jgi:FAD dependent oxidoreductase TIGR03364
MPDKAIVIGAGIIGLATARALAARGVAVTVLERGPKAQGASIRNFGMIWPVGQPEGAMYEMAMSSRSIWEQIAKEAKIWYDAVGSVHLAYNKEEWNVLEEMATLMGHRNYSLLRGNDALKQSAAIVAKGLEGALYSPHEMIVDPRKVIAIIPEWLTEKYAVSFHWGKAATHITYPAVHTEDEVFEADKIYVCSGADFETLYPAVYAASPLTKCKLQMMRLIAQPDNWRMGPALCGGLSLIHYNSFKAATSLRTLKKKYEQEYPAYIKWGIHVMAAQNQEGQITIGDSHEYGAAPDPFDKQLINQLILDYLAGFASFPNEAILETWNGIYAKLTNGESYIIAEPESGVTIINGLGGAGMTLSFGLCEKIIARPDSNRDLPFTSSAILSR